MSALAPFVALVAIVAVIGAIRTGWPIWWAGAVPAGATLVAMIVSAPAPTLYVLLLGGPFVFGVAFVVWMTHVLCSSRAGKVG